MKEELIKDVLQKLGDDFSQDQKYRIGQVITVCLGKYDLQEATTDLIQAEENERFKLFRLFLVSKKIEGCTDRTIKMYSGEIRRFSCSVNKEWGNVTADDIRLYIAQMAIDRGVSKVTQDNTLRVLRSFFGWLTSEEHIRKNPTAKIKRIKQEKRIKKPFTEIEIEKIRNSAADPRQRAIIDVLLSTGMRVGELEGLNRSDIDGDQMVVYGKGEKERYVYLNAKAIVSLDVYLKTRDDSENALFVGCDKPHRRLARGQIEKELRDLGNEIGIRIYPHRFRRTAATLALNRGMPIDQVQAMLGHEQIATTMIYAQTASESVKESHKKYLA